MKPFFDRSNLLIFIFAQLDASIDPVILKYNSLFSKNFQSRIDSHFHLSYKDDFKFARVRSSRLRAAFNGTAVHETSTSSSVALVLDAGGEGLRAGSGTGRKKGKKALP